MLSIKRIPIEENILNTCKDQYPVFVYGTLRPGFSNYFNYSDRVELIKPAELAGYQLWNLGLFPGMSPGQFSENPVQGELLYFEEQTWAEVLQSLDYLEGEGYFYDRVLLEVYSFSDRGPVRAWTYRIRMSISYLRMYANMLESNDWSK